jgi:outer membrane protein assembly factor BamB
MVRTILSACVGLLLVSLASGGRAADWPQWLGPQRDGVWRETGLAARFPAGGPRVLWRKKIGGGYAGPAVAGGLVYVTDRVLDAGASNPKNPFDRSPVSGKERILCFEADSGNPVWEQSWRCKYTISYPCGPRATPVVAGGKVYVLGAMGQLNCYEAKAGKPVWSRDLVKDFDAEPPLWGFSAHPLLDGDNLICLVGKKPVVVAFDRNTGKENWRALELTRGAEVGYAPPMVYTFGGKRCLVIWHPESVNGLDPATGKVLWSFAHRTPIKANLTVPTPRQVGDRLFLTSFYNGSLMLQVTAGEKWSVKQLWASKSRSERPEGTDKLHSIMPTPVIQGDHIYGVCSYGELRCLNLADGKRVWSNLTATGTGGATERWANAFLVPQGDRFILFNEKGELILAKLTPKGYEEIDRAKILAPTGPIGPKRKVLWSHPAFANKTVYARNDEEIVAVSLAAPK